MGDLASTSEKAIRDEIIGIIVTNAIGGTDDFPAVNLAGIIGDLEDLALASTAPAESGEPVITDGMIDAIHHVYQMKVMEYDADFRNSMLPEGAWEKKYGTFLHSTSLGEKWAMKQALSIVRAHIHPPAESAGSTSGVGVPIADDEQFSWFDTLNSCLETFWAITQPDTDNRLLAEGALDALQALQATTLSAATSDPSRDTQPALLSTDETKEGGNG